MTLLKRLLTSLLQFLYALDIVAQVLIRAPIYIATGHNKPSAHETISAWVGASAALGKSWAVFTAAALDAVFGAGHCARAALREASVSTSAN